MNQQSKNHYDLIIIGGGAAGMMSAISAKRHNPDFKIAIIDRTFALGRKILVCGAGRCNITNINLAESYESKYYGAEKDFIKSVFEQFGYKDIIKFFNDLGVGLYVERKTDIGKLFPVTNQASTITEMLLDEIEGAQIDVYLNTEVKEVKSLTSNFQLLTSSVPYKDQKEITNKTFTCSKLILSAGGRSYPALGSNGSGYDIAKNLGHTIIEPVPSALPVESKNLLSHLLQGVKVEMEVTTFIDNKQIKSSIDEVMFTKYGFSGPAILNVSREISIRINREKKSDVKLRLNFFPQKNLREIKNFLEERWSKRPNQGIEKSLYGLFPNKVAKAIVEISSIQNTKKVKDLTSDEKKDLVDNLGFYEANVHATRGWNEAEFSAGGIETSEVHSTSLESKIVKNLYFSGEILNVDGDVGGFNLSWAWSSGFVAGKLQ